jgi:hypothetical protein
VEGALDAELLQLASDRALTAKLGAKLMDWWTVRDKETDGIPIFKFRWTTDVHG